MYYILVPESICAERRIFSQNLRTPDGRVVLTMRDLGLTQFSFGMVELINGTDLKRIMSSAASADGTEPAADNDSPLEEPAPDNDSDTEGPAEEGDSGSDAEDAGDEETNN